MINHGDSTSRQVEYSTVTSRPWNFTPFHELIGWFRRMQNADWWNISREYIKQGQIDISYHEICNRCGVDVGRHDITLLSNWNERAIYYTEKTTFPFPFKLNGIWSWWQFSFRFWTKWNSIWFKIKTVTTTIFHSIRKEMEM